MEMEKNTFPPISPCLEFSPEKPIFESSDVKPTTPKMKYLFFFLAFFCAQLTFGQLVFESSSNYYEGDYDKYKGQCYCKSFKVDSSFLTSFVLENYITLNVVATWENLWPFRYNEDDFLVLPYEVPGEDAQGVYSELNKEQDKWLLDFSTDNPLLDTVYVLRNQSSIYWYDGETHEPLGAGSKRVDYDYVNMYSRTKPYQEFRFSVLKDTANFPYFRTVHIEFHEGDGVNRLGNRKIICPEKIKVALIERMNDRLIEMGYLTNEKRRKFLPEVREALFQFQEDYNLEVGYVDQQTLDYLDINWVVDQ